MADRPGLRQIEKGYVEVSYTVYCRCHKCSRPDYVNWVTKYETYQDLDLKKGDLYDHLVSGEWGVRTESDGFQPWRLVKGKLIHPDCFLRMSDES